MTTGFGAPATGTPQPDVAYSVPFMLTTISIMASKNSRGISSLAVFYAS